MTWIDRQDPVKVEAALARLVADRDNPKYRDVFKYAGTNDRYALWLISTDAHCRTTRGVSIFDLADYCWGDAYEDGSSPAEAIRMAVAAEFG